MGDNRVRAEKMAGKGVRDVMGRAKGIMWDNMESRTMFVVKAGLNDVFSHRWWNLGRQLEKGIKELRTVAENVRVVLCTILLGTKGGDSTRGATGK